MVRKNFFDLAYDFRFAQIVDLGDQVDLAFKFNFPNIILAFS